MSEQAYEHPVHTLPVAITLHQCLFQLDILINSKPVDALSSIVHKDKAVSIGKHICSRLKENIHRYVYVRVRGSKIK